MSVCYHIVHTPIPANECNLTRGRAVEQVERTYEATDEVAIH